MRFLTAISIAVSASCVSAAGLRALDGTLVGGLRLGQLMPFVIGHRGIPSVYPENTMISFQAALQAGVDGIESDLHLTKDNVLVLLHDDTLDRTTNCTGYVWNYTLAQLASCNANYPSIYGDKWGFQPIPTFESVVQLIADAGVFFVLDLKAEAILGSYIRPIVDKYNAASLVAMSCWTFPQLADAVLTMNASARQLLNDTAWGMPGQPGGENLTRDQAAAAWASYLALGIRGFSVGFETLTPTFIQQAHARLMPVYAWTVDNAQDVETVINLGVDGILTNKAPDVMAAVQARLAEALDYSGGRSPSYGPGQMAGAIVGALLVGGIAVLAANFALHRCRRPGYGAGGAGGGAGGASVNTAGSAGFYTPYSHVAGDAGN